MLITLLYKNSEIGVYDTVTRKITYNDRYYQLIDIDPSITKLTPSLNAFFSYGYPEGRQLQLFQNAYIREIRKGNFPWLSESSNFSFNKANRKDYFPVPKNMPPLPVIKSDIPPELFRAENAWKRGIAPIYSGYQDKFPAFLTHRADGWVITTLPEGVTGNVIIKPAGTKFSYMPENEYIFMQLAERAGLPTPRTWLCCDSTGSIHYAIERFGIYRDSQGQVLRENTMDFLGLMGLDARHKYDASLEAFFGTANKCLSPYDYNQFARTWYYGFLVGNTDQHPKNFSVFVRNAGIKLAPIYDMVHMLCYGRAPLSCMKLEGKRDYPSRQELERFIQSSLSQTEIDEIKTCVLTNVYGIINNTFKLANKIRKAAYPKADLSTAEIIRSRITEFFDIICR